MTIKVSIKIKLLMLSIAVLSIPYVGYQYLREMEQYLRDSLEASLIDSAIAVSGPLHNKDVLFPSSAQVETPSVFVHKLTHPIQMDGYTDDWMSYLSWSDTYMEENAISDDPLSYKFIISRYQQYYYALLQVQDTRLTYRVREDPGALNNDHVILSFKNYNGDLLHYYFSPADSGEFTPFELIRVTDKFGVENSEYIHKTNIGAYWRQTDSGYNLEIRIPVNVIWETLGITVLDVDDPKLRTVTSVIGTAGRQTQINPGRVLQSSPAIESMIENYARTEGRRIWVLDNYGQVLATTGSLTKDLPGPTFNLLYSLLLPPVHQRFSDDLSGASRLQGDEISAALEGIPGSRWRISPDDRAIIVSAAAPVMINKMPNGIVVVEETTSHIQIQQRQAMASLFNKSLFVFIFVTLLLLIFATRLSIRLRQLERDAAAAIDQHGRVIGGFRTSNSTDEIGDLSRNYAAMLDRLKEYNQYLEMLAGRLSHELRTPMTVVQSSLDQLKETNSSSKKQTYLERAREGIHRLNTIVIRLSEATRLEQALQNTECRIEDVNELVTNCIEGYRVAFPDVEFVLDTPDQVLSRNIAADLIVQMLDKVIKNAIDFKSLDSPLEISLKDNEENWEINVLNYGQSLPESMEEQLFNSMISFRGKKDDSEPHLGLGLYIVRLVVEFHGGVVSAKNLPDKKGVNIKMVFPG
ncbi:MAG: proteobacterial dedicated sortase system histidine kinase [Gammaproteobacteria bacterium]|nr:proteobacterial dedicated sortase system histidine kinase [Gammaproteobacteria bacterium]